MYSSSSSYQDEGHVGLNMPGSSFVEDKPSRRKGKILALCTIGAVVTVVALSGGSAAEVAAVGVAANQAPAESADAKDTAQADAKDTTQANGESASSSGQYDWKQWTGGANVGSGSSGGQYDWKQWTGGADVGGGGAASGAPQGYDWQKMAEDGKKQTENYMAKGLQYAGKNAPDANNGWGKYATSSVQQEASETEKTAAPEKPQGGFDWKKQLCGDKSKTKLPAALKKKLCEGDADAHPEPKSKGHPLSKVAPKPSLEQPSADDIVSSAAGVLSELNAQMKAGAPCKTIKALADQLNQAAAGEGLASVSLNVNC
jgi:hypothetical protein